jgi:inositol 3-alpha-galactosyltransferase
MASGTKRYAYVTLLSQSSYLPGLVILAYSLSKCGSKYPLHVLCTQNLDQEIINALQTEASYSSLIIHRVEQLKPGQDDQASLVSSRFAEAWNKLWAFSPLFFDYDKLCYLDADILVRNSKIDTIFDCAKLPGPDWLAASHNCCCNFHHEDWAPSEWRPEVCAFTNLKHPDALTKPTPAGRRGQGMETHALFNAGVFVFRPNANLWDRMMQSLESCDHISEFKFADQDFLIEFFAGRWTSIGWQFNAFKTLRYIHPNIWRDEEVVCLHYVHEKPWNKSQVHDETSDEEDMESITHSWWWRTYVNWMKERNSEREGKLIAAVENR